MTIRKSVPTKGITKWWLCGWAYVMPDFDRPDRSIIEWIGNQTPIEPVFTCVPEINNNREGK